MLNFRPLGYLDLFDLMPSVRSRLSLFVDSRGSRILELRRPTEGEKWWRARELSKWTELTNTLGRIQRAGEQFVGKVQRGRIFLEMLDPGAMTPWIIEADQNWLRLYLPIRTNPAVIVYRGVEAMHLAAGNLTLVSMAGPASAINAGETPAITLISDFRPMPTAQKEAQE